MIQPLAKKNQVLRQNEKYHITLCHEKKFLWFRVAKIGTRTIYNVLRQTGITFEDVDMVRCHGSFDLYRDYFKFAFIRNPWDRLVSCWLDKVIKKNAFNFSPKQYLQMQEFEKFIDYIAQKDLENSNRHYRLQSRLVNLDCVDYLGRFENFESDLNKIINVLQFGAVKIKKINKSPGRKNYREYYNDRTILKVADMYCEDIRLFSYEY